MLHVASQRPHAFALRSSQPSIGVSVLPSPQKSVSRPVINALQSSWQNIPVHDVRPYGHSVSSLVLPSSQVSNGAPAGSPSPHTLPLRFSTPEQSASQAVQNATP